MDTARARSETIGLLTRAFQDQGGDQAAFARARDGVQGGMRSALDRLTEQYRAERQAGYIQRVLKDAVDALDWQERVRFMQGALKRLGPFLPVELRDQPAERFVKNHEIIAQAYVESIDKVGRLLRSM